MYNNIENIDEVYQGIYRIGVPLRGNPLKELNSYYIRPYMSFHTTDSVL